MPSTLNINRFATPPKSIAILRLSALGDITMLIPSILQIRKKWPHCKISFITNINFLNFLKYLESFNIDLIGIHKPKKISDYLQLKKQFKKYNFDILLATQASFRVNLLYSMINAPIKLGFDKQRARDFQSFFITHQIPAQNQHILEGFWSFIHTIGASNSKIPTKPVQSCLEQSIKNLDTSRNTQLSTVLKGNPYIVINLAASKPERTPTQRFYLTLIDLLVQRYSNYNVILTGGNSCFENEISESIILATKDKYSSATIVNLCGKTNIKELIKLIHTASVVIAPDTGPIHIASLINTPCIGLYAIINKEISGPYNHLDLCIDKYTQAFRELVSTKKTPLWGERIHNRKAMDLITPDMIIQQCQKIVD